MFRSRNTRKVAPVTVPVSCAPINRPKFVSIDSNDSRIHAREDEFIARFGR